MSDPLRGEYADALEREIAFWPGVAFRMEVGRKHCRAFLTFKGAERFVVFASSGSDSRRGVRHFITDVRGELRNLGAARTEQRRSARPARSRSAPRREALPTISDPRPDGFAQLRELQARMMNETPAAKVKRTFWTAVSQLFRRAA